MCVWLRCTVFARTNAAATIIIRCEGGHYLRTATILGMLSALTSSIHRVSNFSTSGSAPL